MESMDSSSMDSGNETMLNNTTVKNRNDGRSLWRQYSEINKELDENKDALINDPKRLRSVMNKADMLHRKVERPTETVADANTFVKLTEKVRGQVEMISRTEETQINVSELATKFATQKTAINGELGDDGLLQINEEKWRDFGKAVAKYYSRVPSLSYLHGAIEKGAIEAKQKITRPSVARSAAQKAAPRPEPATAITKRVAEQREDDSVEVLVDAMCDFLVGECRRRGQKKIGFWELVVDPDSFAQTVENIFHTTFLVKERRAFIIVSDNLDEYSIEPISRKSSSENIESDQYVMSFTVKQWKDVKEKLNIKNALLPKPGASM